MKRTRVAIVGLLIIVLMVAVVVWRMFDRTTHPARLGVLPIVASLPVHVAEDRGLFQHAGLEVRLTTINSSNDLVNALVARQIDVLPAVSLVPLLHLEAQYPGTIRVFSHSRMVQERAFDSVITRNDSDITELDHLTNTRIGVFPGTSASNMLRAFLERQGVTTSEITFVPLAPPSQLASLDSGAIDALFTYEPITTVAEATGRYRQLYGSVYATLLSPCPIGASAISREFERENPEVAAAVIGVIDQAVEAMRTDSAGTKALLTNALGLDASIAQRVNVVDVTISNELDVQQLQEFIDLLVEVGELPRRIDAAALVAP